jgi:Ca2+-binding EF-hand superfamily protein
MAHLKKFDLDGDGVIGDADVQTVANAIGATRGTPRYDDRCDFDHDGVVSGKDLSAIAAHYGQDIHGEPIEG